jgi:uncharacterized protein (DUF2141 family)
MVYCFLFVTISAFSQNNVLHNFTVEINNVITNGGTIHVSVSINETSYKRQIPNYTFQINSSGNIIRTEIALPIGECVINVYQDLNGNGKCDTGLFGIPKEPVGITNWDGRGVPGSYNRLKINVDNETRIISINLYQL